MTNYQNNILKYSPNKTNEENVFLYYSDSHYKIYFDNSIPKPISSSNKTLSRQNYEYDQLMLKKTTIQQKPKVEIDSTKVEETKVLDSEQIININDYKFEAELVNSKVDKDSEFDENGLAIEPRTNKYMTTFYTNYLVTQVDFGFLSNSYQAFTGSAFYFNPGFNVIFKVGSSDLFEDYRITAGFRFAGNFDSNEYLLSFENLKKRWNKQFVFHRQSVSNYYQDKYAKTITHEGFYILRYPLSQVDAFQITTNLRNNQISFLSGDYESLMAPNQYDYWASIKGEYIFDNTKSIATNIYDGMRFKAFGEVYKQLDKKETDMFVVGGDFRFYHPIHRNIIIATRFAASSSFGRAKLIYYLGGMDNWINLSSNNPTFDYSIRIDPEINYVYQAVATNLRGFSQNIRNGTNFAVMNTEIRWPIISYFYNRPINNDFVKNFQVIGFFDIGTAWSGLSPFSGNNAYENDYYDNYPVNIIIHNDKYPIVSGYGFGLRSKIFGYFIRADWAWGIENNVIQPKMFYLSLSLDF